MDTNENLILRKTKEGVAGNVEEKSFESEKSLTEEDMFEDFHMPFAESQIKCFNSEFNCAGISMSLNDKFKVTICIDVNLFGGGGDKMDNVFDLEFVRYYSMLNIFPTSSNSEVIVSREDHYRRFSISYSTEFLISILCLSDKLYKLLGLNCEYGYEEFSIE